MAAKVDVDKCVGCGACAGECPAGAITIENDKAKVGESCIECGVCTGVCPAEAITL